MTTHTHVWTQLPTLSTIKTLRYECACGELGWREVRSRGGKRWLTELVPYKPGDTVDTLRRMLAAERAASSAQPTDPQGRAREAKRAAWGAQDG
jgi:hypothetical protein